METSDKSDIRRVLRSASNVKGTAQSKESVGETTDNIPSWIRNALTREGVTTINWLEREPTPDTQTSEDLSDGEIHESSRPLSNADLMKRITTLQTSLESLTKTTITLAKAFETVSRAVEVQNQLLAQAGFPTLAQITAGHPGTGALPVIPEQLRSYQAAYSGQHAPRVPQRSLASTTTYTPPIQPKGAGIGGGSTVTKGTMPWNYRGASTSQPNPRDYSYSASIPYDSSASRQGPTTSGPFTKPHFIPNYPTLSHHDVSAAGPSTVPTSSMSPSATLSTTSSLPTQDEVLTYAMDEPTVAVDGSDSIIPGLALHGLLSSSTSMQTQATEIGSGKTSKNRKRRYKNREKKRLALARTLEHTAKRQQLQ